MEMQNINWISVDEQMPKYNQPVLACCNNAPYQMDGYKIVVASFVSKDYLKETMEDYDGQDENWYAEVSLFDDEYGSRLLNEEVTHWMPLPIPPKGAEQ